MDCVCDGRFFSRPAVFTCVDGAWEFSAELSPSCGCDDEGNATGAGGSAGESAGLGGEAGLGNEAGRGGESAAGAASDQPDTVPPGTCPGESAVSAGLFSCNHGSFVHRTEPATCEVPERDPADRPPSTEPTDDQDYACNHDADCGAGYCVRETVEVDLIHRCIEPCVEDADCADGNVCICEQHERATTHEGIVLGECRPAACAKDAECGAGFFCRAPVPENGRAHPYRSFSCQTAGDECSGQRECPSDPELPDDLPVCRPDALGERLVCGVENPF